MEGDKLVYMANQIAAFFQSYPEPDAAKGIAEHIAAFWTPGMRDGLRSRIAADGTGVEKLVALAMSAPAGLEALARSPGESPVKAERQGPDVLGEMTSDAG